MSQSLPKTKGKIDGKLTESFKINWASSNIPTEFRVKLGHMKDIKKYLDNKELNRRLEEMDVEVSVDRVQAETRAVAGYLAGPIIKERTAEIIADILISKIIF